MVNEAKTRRTARFIASLGVIVLVATIIFAYTSDTQSTTRLLGGRRQLAATTDLQKKDDRPIIYTFYNPLLEDAFVTQMTESGDAALVEEWKASWWEAGFDPRVLTLEDARSHPMFIPINYAMEHTWLDGYNKMCIWRWVAMSNVGGGWMSDYDVFPLRLFDTTELPNEGALTVHDRFIPDLVSGSSEEWIRVAQEIVNGLLEKDAEKKIEAQSYPPQKKKRRQYTLWTDMFALQQWQLKEQKGESPAMFQSDSMVMLRAFDKEDEALGQAWSSEKCLQRTPSNIKAVHFSHDAITSGMKKKLLHEGQSMDHRAEIAKEWIASWRSSCGNLEQNADIR